MRAYSSSIWGLAASLSSIVAAQNDVTFIFDGSSFCGQMFGPATPGSQSSVFNYASIEHGKVFRWDQTGGPVEVLRLDLMNGDGQSIASWCGEGMCAASSPGFSVEKAGSAGTITLGPYVTQRIHYFLGSALYFRLDWQPVGGGEKSASYSQRWAVADNDDAVGSVYSSYKTVMTAGAAPVSSPGPAPLSVVAAVVGAGPQATVLPTASPSATSTPTPHQSGRKNKGLKAGAIVGLVFGCVGGLMLVGVVAGCLCFRRHRNAGIDRGSSRDAHAIEGIIAEKEASASTFDRDQPDAPYCGQNSRRPLNRGAAMAGSLDSGGLDTGAGDSEARSPSSLYSNPIDELHPISPEAAADAGGVTSQPRPTRLGRSATPSGISGQYAHLVEEGMTEDEIRRLEEEERALDEAIELAETAGRQVC